MRQASRKWGSIGPLVLLAVEAGALVVAGCGGGGSGPASATDAAASEASAADATGTGAGDAASESASADAAPADGAVVDASLDSAAGDAAADTAASDAAPADASDGAVCGALYGPPAPGSPVAPDGTSDVTIAVDRLFYGDTHPDGTPDQTNGWQYYGYNLDHVSPCNLASFCQPVGNAMAKLVHTEGTLPGRFGVENNFGRLVLPVLTGVNYRFTSQGNAQIAGGNLTMMLSMHDLGSGSSYSPLLTEYYQGGNLGSVPRFGVGDAGLDQWPVLPGLLVNPADASQGSSVQFPGAYVTGNTWVATGPGPVPLRINAAGSLGISAQEVLTLTVHDPVITMQLDAAHRTATTGIIAGVLWTSELVAELRSYLGYLDTALCPGPTIDSIAAQVQQASDILDDGTQDPTKTCDGISFAIGFTGAVVAIHGVSPAPVPPPYPCTVDSGADGGGDAASD